MQEAKIIINGVEITNAMSMTVRVALESFAMGLSDDGLGDDESGKRTARLYLSRVNEIRPLLSKEIKHT